LAMYRRHCLQIISTNRRWLLETDVSIIDSTPQSRTSAKTWTSARPPSLSQGDERASALADFLERRREFTELRNETQVSFFVGNYLSCVHRRDFRLVHSFEL
jgi:hypothetical protein